MADTPAERLRDIAERLSDCAVVNRETDYVEVFFDDDLVAIADELDLAVSPPIVTTLCLMKGSRRDDPCDRPAKHHGEHSWRAARLLRRLGEYEETARRVPKLERQVATLSAQLKGTRAELAEEQSRRRFRKRKPDRG
jgi:hypothetical protein